MSEIIVATLAIGLLLLACRHNALVKAFCDLRDSQTSLLPLLQRYVDDRIEASNLPSADVINAQRAEIRALREDAQKTWKEIKNLEEELNRTLAVMDAMTTRANGTRNLLGMLANSHTALEARVQALCKAKKIILKKIDRCKKK